MILLFGRQKAGAFLFGREGEVGFYDHGGFLLAEGEAILAALEKPLHRAGEISRFRVPPVSLLDQGRGDVKLPGI